MKTVLSDKVKRKVAEYYDYLAYYVSEERQEEKANNLADYLYGIGDLLFHRVCPNESLGQVFDRQGRPLITNLMRVNYSDESRFQWAIVYLIDEANDTVLVIDILPASSVK